MTIYKMEEGQILGEWLTANRAILNQYNIDDLALHLEIVSKARFWKNEQGEYRIELWNLAEVINSEETKCWEYMGCLFGDRSGDIPADMVGCIRNIHALDKTCYAPYIIVARYSDNYTNNTIEFIEWTDDNLMTLVLCHE